MKRETPQQISYLYNAVFTEEEIVFGASKTHPAQTVGRLNQKFFGNCPMVRSGCKRWSETVVSSLNF
jgi:hypothetical protein